MTELNYVEKVDLGFTSIGLLSNDFLIYDFKDDIIIDRADVDLMIKEHTLLSKGVPRFVIVKTGQRMSITPEGRAFDSLDFRKNITRAEALIVNNIATRIGANFYYLIQRPPYPVKSFTNLDQGFSWLEKLRQEIGDMPT